MTPSATLSFTVKLDQAEKQVAHPGYEIMVWYRDQSDCFWPSSVLPGFLVSDHGVENYEQFAHGGDDGDEAVAQCLEGEGCG